MKKEYDFSKGERGKFYHPDAELSIPIYLEPDVAKVFRSSAAVSQALRSLLRISATTRRLTKPAKPWLCFAASRLACQVRSTAGAISNHGAKGKPSVSVLPNAFSTPPTRLFAQANRQPQPPRSGKGGR